MADLLDIAPSTASAVVDISDNRTLTVRGLHWPEVAAIAARFPNIVAAIVAANDNVVVLCSSAGMAIGAIIAAGCGHPGNDKAEQIAGSLLLEDQINLAGEIYRLSFPNGFSPVMKAIEKLMTGAADEKPKPARVRLKQSPSPLPASSDEDSRQNIQ
jgi:hypothetical protein